MTVTALPGRDAPLELLVTALDRLAAERPVELPGSAALERARGLLDAVERVRALALLAVADVEERELYALDGAGSAASWVADQQLPGADRAEVALALRGAGGAWRAGTGSGPTTPSSTAAPGGPPSPTPSPCATSTTTGSTATATGSGSGTAARQARTVG